MNLRVSSMDLVRAAEREIATLSPEGAARRVEEGSALLVDIRDVRELWRHGRPTGALHMPRGMLEFWVDPASPYFKPVFLEETGFIFLCASGWRSALAAKAMADMGLERVAHIGGGFEAWVKAGLPVEPVEPKRQPRD